MISLVIFGSRTANPLPATIAYEIAAMSIDPIRARPLEVISGTARGADLCGEEFAHFYQLPVVRMPADWNLQGKGAGPIRNRAMAERATHGLGFWHRESSGTANMCAHLVALGKPVRLVEWKP